MFGLITMLLTTLGATGMGSMLKIVGGIFSSIAEAKEMQSRRELIRDMQLKNADLKFQKAVFGEVNADNSAFTRGTRRLIALIGMCNFAVISILCTLYPGVELITFTPSRKQRSNYNPLGTRQIPFRRRHHRRDHDRTHFSCINRHSGSDSWFLLYTRW